MTDRREGHAAREAEAWGRLTAVLERIPRERWIEEGVLPGWSVNDVLWHFAGWIERCSNKMKESKAEAAAAEPLTDERMHAMNAEFSAAAHAMDAETIWSGLLAARERLLETWAAAETIDAVAFGRFAGETFEHYEEHLPELQQFAG